MNLIFVIGRNRSGTKWLSNILAENKEVSAILREGAGGILECNLLSTYPNHFNLTNIEEKTAFEILFKYDNFHACSGLDNKVVDNIEYNDIFDFFAQYGQKVSERNGTQYFLQKASSNLLPILVKRFPEARFVIIQRRNVVENVVSNLLLHTNKISYKKLFMLLLGYWRYRKLEDVYVRNFPNIHRVTFENLKANTETTTREVTKFLCLSFEEQMLKPRFSPNTSYKNKVERRKYITPKTKSTVNFISFFMKAVPHPVYNWLYRVRLLSNQDNSKFIAKTFELYRNILTKNE